MTGPVTSSTARLRVLDALEARLDALPAGGTAGPTLTVFAGEVTGDLPLLPDTSGRVAPYAVIFPAPGEPGGESLEGANLEPASGDLLWTGQITFAAGYLTDLVDLLDRVTPWLHGWAPEIPTTPGGPGLQTGRFRPQPGVRPGPVRRDDNARPPRFYAATAWQLHLA